MNMVTGTKEKIKNGDGITWKSENDFIASVSGSVVNAVRQGTVTVTSDKGAFKVNVTPSHTLYSDPCFDWGSSFEDVKSFMNGYDLLTETDEGLLYKGKGAASYVTYIFKNSQLNASGVSVKTTYMDDLVEHLNERYVYVGNDDNEYLLYYVSIDKKMVIGVGAQNVGYSYYYLIMFMNAESANTTKSISAKGLYSAFSSVIKNNNNSKQESCKHLMQKLMQKTGVK